jgi:hypothetical protein
MILSQVNVSTIQAYLATHCWPDANEQASSVDLPVPRVDYAYNFAWRYVEADIFENRLATRRSCHHVFKLQCPASVAACCFVVPLLCKQFQSGKAVRTQQLLPDANRQFNRAKCFAKQNGCCNHAWGK